MTRRQVTTRSAVATIATFASVLITTGATQLAALCVENSPERRGDDAASAARLQPTRRWQPTNRRVADRGPMLSSGQPWSWRRGQGAGGGGCWAVVAFGSLFK
jgi:hypothetical protein